MAIQTIYHILTPLDNNCVNCFKTIACFLKKILDFPLILRKKFLTISS